MQLFIISIITLHGKAVHVGFQIISLKNKSITTIKKRWNMFLSMYITTLLMESQHIGCKENEPKERLMGKIILGVIQCISAWMNKYKNDHIHISAHIQPRTHPYTFILIPTRLYLHTNVMPNTNKLILQMKHN